MRLDFQKASVCTTCKEKGTDAGGHHKEYDSGWDHNQFTHRHLQKQQPERLSILSFKENNLPPPGVQGRSNWAQYMEVGCLGRDFRLKLNAVLLYCWAWSDPISFEQAGRDGISSESSITWFSNDILLSAVKTRKTYLPYKCQKREHR